ncbi:MAG: RecQ family ATP-dependent DNA helicase [Saprospiraceae bacterium]|nr:RecQ family ATP-dependent DNA helicase [Saprospiraceae bacterium]
MDTPLNILKKFWGYDAFRTLQTDIIQSVLDGKDTLALMPTGGGKSICFQVPALCQEGICIVISPLIALMKDQVHNLRQRNIPAAAIYSGMHSIEIDRTFDNCVYGNIKLLYLSPERLVTDLARERISRMHVNLLAIDEAHCISQWGYDFRPPYLEIANIRELLPKAPMLALTATATPEVVEDIQEKLQFKSKNAFQKSFARSNLAYVVLNEEGKMEKLLDILKKVKGSGVVYVRNRRKTKEIAQFLIQKGISADFYHAGLQPEERSEKQDAWIENQTRIMVSTNAFGMGIDKPDVRVVVHMELPDSLEAYFQEAGRAGRDGKKSYAVLLYNHNDRQSLEKNYALAFPEINEIRRVYHALGSYYQLAIGAGAGLSYDFDMISFGKNFQLEPIKTLHALKTLEQAGWLTLSEAVYTPASLLVKVSKEELYDYQLRHPKHDLILKAILRSYQGTFSHFVNIRESQLASFLKISTEEVIKTLHLLHKDNIIEYLPQSDQPQLTFLRDRVDSNDLTIDHQLYEFRRKRHWERIQKAIAYAEEPICRSRQLLNYFGEKNDKDCGICDVCLGRTKADLSNADYDAIKNKIQEKLNEKVITLEQLMSGFSSVSHEKVLRVLEYLLDEGFVIQEGSALKWQ